MTAFSSVEAWSWQGTYSVQHKMSEAESQIMARDIALAKIQTLALQDAGSYIVGTQQLHADEYTETIELISATILSMTNIQSSLSLEADGQLILAVTATARVDEDETERRISQYLKTQSMHETIDKLKSENQQIKKNLESLLNKNELSSSELQRTTQLITSQSKTFKETKNVLYEEKYQLNAGQIATKAQLSLAANNKLFEDIDNTLYGEMLNPVVSINVIDVTGRSDGTIEFTVEPYWTLNHVELIKYLSRIFGPVNEYEDLTALHSHSVPRDKGGVFDYLKENPVYVRLSFNGHEQDFPLAYVGSGFFPNPDSQCKTPINERSRGVVNASGKTFCIISSNWESPMLRKKGRFRAMTPESINDLSIQIVTGE